MQTHLGTELTLIQEIRLTILGITSTNKRTNPGWEGEIMYYAFKCPRHGVVEDYPHGFNHRLRCPICQKNLYRKNNLSYTENTKYK